MAIGSHIIPKFYLERFANPPNRKRGQCRLWVYRKGEKPDYRATSVQGAENGYFALVESDGNVNESLEKRLELLEESALETLVLAATPFIDLRSASRRNALAFYAAMLFCRATQRRNRTQATYADMYSQFAQLAVDDEWIDEVTQRYIAARQSSVEPSMLKQKIAQMASLMEGTTRIRNNFVEDLLETIENLKGFLLQKPWQLWNAPKGSEFVTSDNPVISFLPIGNGELNPGHGFRKPDVIGAFPLAPHVCLSMGPQNLRGADSIEVDANRVTKVNETMIRLCDKFVYSKTLTQETKLAVDKYANTARYGETAFLPIGLTVPTAKDFVLYWLGIGPWPFGRSASSAAAARP